jgi:hypothetical protein
MRLFIDVLRTLRKTGQEHSHRRTLANDARYSDLYLVEFPKSGITWLSSILANVALIESGRPERAGFVSARMHIPDIHFSRDIGDVCYSRPPNRMIKSHSEYNPLYNFVVYLAREPLAVMKSYYVFLEEQGHSLGSLEEFCFSNPLGLTAWKRHIDSWLNGPQTGRPLHLLRHEDLRVSPVREVQKISEHFSWNLSQESITEAVHLSDLSVMKAQEEFHRTLNPRHRITFVQNPREVRISAELEDRVNQHCRAERTLLGYAQ